MNQKRNSRAVAVRQVRGIACWLPLAALWIGVPAVAGDGRDAPPGEWSSGASGQRLVAQAATERGAFDIPAQPLATALNDFGRQAGMQVTVDAALVSGIQGKPVAGSLTPEQALARLLSGTGIAWRLTDPRTVTLEKVATAVSPAMLGAVTAEAQRETAWGPVKGYVAKRSASATKTDTPIIETPRSVSVVTSDQIDVQKAGEIREVLRYTPGVVAEARGTDFSQPSLIIRGFQSFDPIYRDGMKGHGRNFLTYGSTAIEPYGLERVEVFRGPASILYGQGQAGGLVNAVTKRPPEAFFAEVEGNAGSFNRYGGRFDLGGPVQDGALSLRLTGLLRDGGTQVEHLGEGRAYVAPALTWRPSSDTTLTILSNYQQDDTVGGQIIPFTALTNPNGKISTSTLLSEPNYERYDNDHASVGYLFDHRFDDTWSLHHKLRYDSFEVDYRSLYSAGFQADNRTLNRSVFTAAENGYYITTDTAAEAKAELGPMKHDFLFGVDYKKAALTAAQGFAAGPSIDPFNPVYGQPVVDPPLYQDQQEDTYQVGLYLQDQIKVFDRFIVTLGGRQDWASSMVRSRLTGAETRQDDDAFTGQVGMLYQFDSGFAPYVSFAESFEPQSGTDAAGRPFVPTTGKQYEVGLKYQPKGVNALVTVAGFELTRQNILTADPDNVNFQIQVGEARSRGLELEAKAEPLENLRLIAAYSFIHTEITKSNGNNGNDKGNRLDGVPEHAASFWGDYTIDGGKFADGAFDGLGFGAGVRYVGTTVDVANSIKVPSVTLADAAIHYDWNSLHLALNASNLFDKSFVSTCFSPDFCYFGQRRVVTASVRYRW